MKTVTFVCDKCGTVMDETERRKVVLSVRYIPVDDEGRLPETTDAVARDFCVSCLNSSGVVSLQDSMHGYWNSQYGKPEVLVKKKK